MEKKARLLISAILSLSFLTVMAGAAIAPALDIIQEHFKNTDEVLVQMLISVPALFIILTSFIFPLLCRHFSTRQLTLSSLALYIAAGCSAYFISNIWLILATRAVLGISVGVLMPLSTGLLVMYSAPEEHPRLMGMASAFNYLGAVVATLLTGMLSRIGWNLSFLVYLVALVPMAACLLYLPSDRIPSRGGSPFTAGNMRKYLLYMAAMYLAMGTFFIYPTNFAIQVASDGYRIPGAAITPIMAGLDVIAMVMGIMFEKIIHVMKGKLRYLAPVTFILGYALLLATPQPAWAITGSALVGIGSGIGIPYVFATASRKAGREESAMVMPLLSASMFLAQFTIPFIVSAGRAMGIGAYATALVLSAAMLAFNSWKGRNS